MGEDDYGRGTSDRSQNSVNPLDLACRVACPM